MFHVALKIGLKRDVLVLPESFDLSGVPLGNSGCGLNQWLRLQEQVRMLQKSCLFSGFTLYTLYPIGPKQAVFKVAVHDWLSLSASPISRLSGRLQFGPHAEVTFLASLYCLQTFIRSKLHPSQWAFLFLLQPRF